MKNNFNEERIQLIQQQLRHQELQAAEKSIQALIEEGACNAELYNMQGVVLFKQQQYDRAIDAFIQALKQRSDFIEAMYNLALAYRANQQVDDAIDSFLAILSVVRSHESSYLMLGKIFLEKKEPSSAEKLFNKALTEIDVNDQFLQRVINTFLLFDRYQEAKPFCELLQKRQPELTSNLYDLGVIETKLGERSRAKNYYRAVLTIDANHFPALNNLAIIYLEEQNFQAAKFYFEAALQLQPNNESIKYSLNAVTGGHQFKDAPKAYIKTLFDQYADHYETHLTKGLEYVAPEKLKRYLDENLIKLNELIILDLGCGTGLCGPIFRSMAKRLVGVDLSEKMVEQARNKNCYDKLVVEDNQDYLQQQREQFDLIIAADVFIYQGDLFSLFESIYQALKSRGVLAFTLEANETESYRLEQTGRFSHGVSYIEELAKKLGFTTLLSELDETRTQNQNRLLGHYVLLEKPEHSIKNSS